MTRFCKLQTFVFRLKQLVITYLFYHLYSPYSTPSVWKRGLGFSGSRWLRIVFWTGFLASSTKYFWFYARFTTAKTFEVVFTSLQKKFKTRSWHCSAEGRFSGSTSQHSFMSSCQQGGGSKWASKCSGRYPLPTFLKKSSRVKKTSFENACFPYQISHNIIPRL